VSTNPHYDVSQRIIYCSKDLNSWQEIKVTPAIEQPVAGVLISRSEEIGEED
jgi:hypothetical protein